MTGTDKLPPVIISKAARPHALKKKSITLSQLKVDYYHNSNGWMTAVIFEHWLEKLNEKLAKQGHHILLLIDNTPSTSQVFKHQSSVPAAQHNLQGATS